MKKCLAVIIMFMALCFMTLNVAASGGTGKGKAKGAGQGASKHYDVNKEQAKHDDSGNKNRDHGNKANKHDEGWEHRGDHEFRIFGDRDQRPPGWSRGKKTGWGNCGVPPGQAKKGECRTYSYLGHRYYYYNDDSGRMVVRRIMLGGR